VANWGGLALHLRGTIGGFQSIASREKWLKVQGGSYFHTFLVPGGVGLQRKFFDRYLKGIDNGWEREPKVEVAVRAPDDTVKRTITGDAWPLPGTRWTRLYLDAGGRSLEWANPKDAASASYPALSEGVTFSTAPLDRDMELAGPIKARLCVASSTADLDLFVTLCAFDPQGNEVTFFSATEPKAPVSQGWLRVTQRKIDPARSTEYQPVHPPRRGAAAHAGRGVRGRRGDLARQPVPARRLPPDPDPAGQGLPARGHRGAGQRVGQLHPRRSRRPPARALRERAHDPHRWRAGVVPAVAGAPINVIPTGVVIPTGRKAGLT
jgi:hypothetical protein